MIIILYRLRAPSRYLVPHSLPYKLVDVTGEISILGVVDCGSSILYQTPQYLNAAMRWLVSGIKTTREHHKEQKVLTEKIYKNKVGYCYYLHSPQTGPDRELTGGGP